MPPELFLQLVRIDHLVHQVHIVIKFRVFQ